MFCYTSCEPLVGSKNRPQGIDPNIKRVHPFMNITESKYDGMVSE